MPRYRPISPHRLTEELAERILTGDRRWTRVGIDGAHLATETAALADALVDPLRVQGHPSIRVSTRDYLRPASLRFEHGKRDPDARYHDWLDTGGLRREVLDPLAPNGSGQVLPALWDAERDRATRQDRVPLPPGGVLLLDGELLLGQGLPLDLTVHLWLSPAALRRRLPESEQWAVGTYERYEEEVAPAEIADVVVRVDDPRHPALLVANGE